MDETPMPVEEGMEEDKPVMPEAGAMPAEGTEEDDMAEKPADGDDAEEGEAPAPAI